MIGTGYPPWVVLHIPHDSTAIPDQVRRQFFLHDHELALELRRMTDHCTHALFAEPPGAATVIRAPVSRLVVDVERFAEDDQEPMAARGMGAVYEVTSHLMPLRRQLSEVERAELMRDWYRPHHERLETAVNDCIARYGRCLVLDGHSFPGTPLPYELADPADKRPDICIGTDSFHTPKRLEQNFVDAFVRSGWSVALNDPFGGAIVPASSYHRDLRVMSVMVEVNRDLYLDPETFEPKADFEKIAAEVRQRCCEALNALDG